MGAPPLGAGEVCLCHCNLPTWSFHAPRLREPMKQHTAAKSTSRLSNVGRIAIFLLAPLACRNAEGAGDPGSAHDPNEVLVAAHTMAAAKMVVETVAEQD